MSVRHYDQNSRRTGRTSVDGHTVRDEAEAISAAKVQNAITTREKKEVRAQAKHDAANARVKMPTFSWGKP